MLPHKQDMKQIVRIKLVKKKKKEDFLLFKKETENIMCPIAIGNDGILYLLASFQNNLYFNVCNTLGNF